MCVRPFYDIAMQRVKPNERTHLETENERFTFFFFSFLTNFKGEGGGK